MASAVDTLKRTIDDDNRYEVPHAEVSALQIEAANELLQSRKTAIKYLGHRAAEVGVEEIRDRRDLVGLLFAHTTYKSYPEALLTDGRWPQLTKWVDSMSTHRVEGIDFTGVEGIDDWSQRLGQAGHFLSNSSGTTGKPSILNASQADLDWAMKNSISSITWSARVKPERKYRMFALAGIASTPRNMLSQKVMADTFCPPGVAHVPYPVPGLTIGAITGMVALRKRVTEGTARPQEIAEYEKVSKERKATADAAVGVTARALVEARREPIFFTGMWATLFKVAEEVRAMGYGGKDFHPENMFFVAGGLKGAVLPPNFREYVFETFNISPDHVAQHYSMQELGTGMPRCPANRYHLPPWLICLLLDEHGESLVPGEGQGELEGRAGFFDLSLDGRWNGLITGDKIQIDYRPCACGSPSPSVHENISRYSETVAGDKITCAGTVDAYVRGLG